MHFHHKQEKNNLIVKLLAFPLLIAIVVGVMIFNRPIRRFINMPKQMVEGAKDGNFQDLSKEKFTQEIKKDTQAEITKIQDNLLNTTIRDVVTFIGKKDKIIHDINHLQKQAGDTVNKVDPFTK